MNIRRHISLLLWTSLLVALLVFSGASQAQTPPFTRNIARFGFGDHHNDYAWSMAWFNGKLYVGTSRSELCVEAATIDFYNPGYYRSPPDGFPEADCPPDKYAMDLRAEIWQYTPETGAWKRVYQSPDDIPNPREPGKFAAGDTVEGPTQAVPASGPALCHGERRTGGRRGHPRGKGPVRLGAGICPGQSRHNADFRDGALQRNSLCRSR